jgi:hypothetical protein
MVNAFAVSDSEHFLVPARRLGVVDTITGAERFGEVEFGV